MGKFITSILTIVCMSLSGLYGQVLPEQMVPLPDFAEEQHELSAHIKEMEAIMGHSEREGTVYEDGQLIRYNMVDSDSRVFTTNKRIEEVRDRYLELMMADMEAEGMPPDALAQYRRFLENEVVSDIGEDPAFPADLDTIEASYARAGIELPDDYMDCLRKLQPHMEDLTAQSFFIGMDELEFRQQHLPPGSYFTIVEVEVQQPHINTLDCKIRDETIIIYHAHRMVLTED